jgi:hypothetical protein
MKLFLTVALSLTAIALMAHAQQYAPGYPPPPGPPSAGYSAAPPPPEMIPPPPSDVAPPADMMPPAQQAVSPAMPPPPSQPPMASSLQPQQQGNITFVSGGAGDEDRDALKQVESQYNLRLLFAARNGDFLANVAVTLSDTRGNAVLDTISDGPIFYAHVPPGRYRLTVSNEGQSQNHDVTIGGGVVSQDFYWASAS